MVLSNGSKSARYQQSISNLQNVCGGVKKAGTAPRIGFYLSNNPSLKRAVQSVPKTCVPSTTVQTQVYGYRATFGM
jgi:hypothetical protein